MAAYDGLTPIHAGRTTTVFRGRRRTDSRAVVIKRLDGPHPGTDQIAALRREYEAIRAAGCDVVVEALDFDAVDGLDAIVLDDIGGDAVSRHIAAGPLTTVEALHVGTAVAEALARVHAASIIHKDVNPSNIIWNRRSGRVQLIDFGIASRVARQTAALSRPERLEGTLAYIAPEQTGRMNRRIDYRADLYSLGVTLYELLRGRRPFDSDDPLEVLHGHIALRAVDVGEVNPSVPPSWPPSSRA